MQQNFQRPDTAEITKLQWIDTARGIAIGLVIVVHVASAFPVDNLALQKLFVAGARGVQLFYVVSAFTLLKSWESRSDGSLRFYLRRFFRIAPLYYLGIPVYLLFNGIGKRYFAPNYDVKVVDIFREVTFLNFIVPSKGTIVPGGWTVSTEVLFYFIFPVAMLFVRNRFFTGWFFATSVGVIIFKESIFNEIQKQFQEINIDVLYAWFSLNLIMQLPYFALGLLLYKNLGFIVKNVERYKLQRFLFPVFVLSFVVISQIQKWVEILWLAPLALLIMYLASSKKNFFINSFLIKLGQVSFSAYLWHFLVLNMIYLLQDKDLGMFSFNGIRSLGFSFSMFILVISLTFVIASFSFKYVEKPFINLGKKIIKILP